MSSSASSRARLVIPSFTLAVLAVPAAAAADGEGSPNESVAEVEAGDVAEAPIHDLDAPVNGIDAPVQDLTARVEDLTVATESEDGSLTDAENDEERTVTLAADVLFEFDEAELTDDASQTLEDAARILEEEADGTTVNIDGYTDAKGADSHNQPLSQDRAEAVERELDELVTGVDITYEVEGHGSADPVAPNEIDGEDNPEGREKNRRVEIRFPR
ncbi:outer membrane protein OmpA-like peptidoglycan-associated protein [Lipingzhangella halophila]|uniref:Outer membrane protein OmpA-like peptidoglycan-associated protein n=1 Tax=Lipingzhangella halophila TaxID=1783352 RepID=A0A7W7W1Z2_9ACTN|nr:OmpA family protein [Lipingzhangella halophila]MBB4930239.1 outer membrane protein OmpA-like peptidoglycan-associated protein [Lipingzhangella halophila]